MRLAVLRAALVALAARGVTGQVPSPNTTPPAVAPPHNSSETMAVAVTCELLGLVSVNVRGAPNTFCVAANTCNTNYIGSCPGSSAVDSKGQPLASGSCCAALENTGDVGCVALTLVQSGAFQCLKHAGSSDSAVVIDISKATPPPTTTAPPSTTKVPVTIKTALDGSREDAGETSAPPTATTTTPTPTPSSPTTTTATPKTISKPDSSSSSSVSSGSSSRSHEPPHVGDEPTITAPQVVPPTTTLPAPTGPLQALAPIPDPPRPSYSGEDRSSDHKTTSSSSKSPVPFSGTGKSSTSSGSSFASAMSGNFVIVIVLGTVASVAVVLGALMLRRNSSGKSSSAASSAPTRSSASKLVSPDVKPTLTLDGDEELFDDLQFRPSAHFSPIFVQPTHTYAETRSPGHDRQSYLL